MLKTAYSIQSIAKEYHKSVTSQGNKNTRGNTEVITSPVLQPFTSF